MKQAMSESVTWSQIIAYYLTDVKMNEQWWNHKTYCYCSHPLNDLYQSKCMIFLQYFHQCATQGFKYL